jgi:hypothetical protein
LAEAWVVEEPQCCKSLRRNTELFVRYATASEDVKPWSTEAEEAAALEDVARTD